MQFRIREQEQVKLIELVSDGNVLFAVAPEYGARLTQLALKHKGECHDLLWEASPEDCKTGAWSKNEILFPFPNRIEDGIYEYNGARYQLPINEKPFNNALHGMVREAKFEVLAQDVRENKASITLSYKYDGNQHYYPFAFTFDVTYTIENNDTFTVIFDVKNDSEETLPFGIGWHPYFKLGESLEGVKLDIPKTDHLLLGERNLPTGEEKPFDHTSLIVSEWNLDDCFRLREGEEAACQLFDDQLSLKMSGSPEYRYLQLFTPEGKGCVAVEPMTSGVNVFNNKEGLRLLEAGDQFSVSFKIALG
ncbi:MAG: hypothetical protein ABJG41_20690 [Cyclobacteriaceae bacterium]